MNVETDLELRREFFVSLNGQEYCIEIGYPKECVCWVHIKVLVCENDLKWWKPIVAEWTESDHRTPDLDILRDAFKKCRDQMRKWVRNWSWYRTAAAGERGGKRAYYTKHANKCHPRILKYAEQWRLCMAVWKEFTKL